MLRLKHLTLLIIALVALATSGLGRVLHESIAHGHADAAAVSHVDTLHDDVHSTAHADHAPPPATPARPGNSPLGHSECPTCVLLAGTVAVFFVIVSAVLAGVAQTFARAFFTPLFVSRPVLPCLSSRGPPALA